MPKWSNARPIEPGYYWFRGICHFFEDDGTECRDQENTIIHVGAGHGSFLHRNYSNELQDFHGVWWKIEPPELDIEPDVEGIV